MKLDLQKQDIARPTTGTSTCVIWAIVREFTSTTNDCENLILMEIHRNHVLDWVALRLYVQSVTATNWFADRKPNACSITKSNTFNCEYQWNRRAENLAASLSSTSIFQRQGWNKSSCMQHCARTTLHTMLWWCTTKLCNILGIKQCQNIRLEYVQVMATCDGKVPCND